MVNRLTLCHKQSYAAFGKLFDLFTRQWSRTNFVQYSWDGGQTWITLGVDLTEKRLEVNLAELPGSDRALVRVLATDGFNTALDQSNAFFKVAKKAPEILILDAPGNGIVFDNVPRSLIAVGNDLEDGALADEAFTWSLDNGRAEVSGPYLNLQKLSLGQHTITLIAKDSDGFETRVSLPRPINVIPGRIKASECCKLIINCPDNIEVLANPNVSSVVVNYPLPRVTDQTANLVCLPPPGTSFPVGTTNIDCKATATSGNIARCAFEITVKSVPPIICPADFSVQAAAGQSSVIVIYPPPIVNTPQSTVVCSPPSGSSFPIGATTVTCTATSPSGDIHNCSFTITVIEQVNAGALCLQDDSSHSILHFDFATGDYEFTSCTGVTLTGTGTVMRHGDIVTLQHYATDRRVVARIDASVRKGTATIQMLSPAITFMIIDRNIADNTCLCP